MKHSPPQPLPFAAQFAALVPAVAAYEAERAETVTARRARGTGRPRAIDVGRQIRERMVEVIAKDGGARVSEIAEALSMTPGRVSHHMSILLAEKKIRRRGSNHDGYEIKRGSHA